MSLEDACDYLKGTMGLKSTRANLVQIGEQATETHGGQIQVTRDKNGNEEAAALGLCPRQMVPGDKGQMAFLWLDS